MNLSICYPINRNERTNSNRIGFSSVHMKNNISDMVFASLEMVDTMMYIIIGLIVALIGAIGWLVYLLAF